MASTFLAHVRDLIGKDQIREAIQVLRDLLHNSPHLQEVLQQSGRYNAVLQQVRLGLVDNVQATLAQNQIRFGLLELVNEIEEQEQGPMIRAELQRFSVNFEKNTVKNSTITAGGNVTIGDTTITESVTSRRLRLFLYAFVPVLAIGFAFFYYQNQVLKQPLQLTVLVSDKTPNPTIPFDKATVTLKYGDKTEPQTIEKEATFKGIPPSVKGKNISLSIEADGFVRIDTAFTFSENTVTIPLSRNNSLGRIYGSIKNEQGDPLADVQIMVLDLSVLSDSMGQFELSIPPDKQRKRQRIKAFKQGFKIWEYETPVIADEESLIIMKK